MNRLSVGARAQIIQALCEGNSIRSTCRITGAAKWTVVRLLVALGQAATDYQDAALRDLPCKRIQADEIWSFIGAKEKNVRIATNKPGMGDAWTWVAIDRDTKLVPSWLVGKRDGEHAQVFMDDLAKRMAGRIELTTDGYSGYVGAVDMSFGEGIDFAQLVKAYGHDQPMAARYSPPEIIGAKPHQIKGHNGSVSTSHVERQNLTMRMQIRRFTRLTNAFSKKLSNHEAAVALHFLHYNFVRVHGSLGTTPAVAAGVSRYKWDVSDIAALLDDPQYANALKDQMRPVRVAS
ncbi:MAG: IS1 family transposase [Chloroflexota bacterium]|nr:IS1 family transposase [Chloroflexota bacterium]